MALSDDWFMEVMPEVMEVLTLTEHLEGTLNQILIASERHQKEPARRARALAGDAVTSLDAVRRALSDIRSAEPVVPDWAREEWVDAVYLDKRRTFTPGQREKLFRLAEGLCQQCGGPLGPSWHADHVKPWICGGRTDIENGQALCAGCNMSKGPRRYQKRYGMYRQVVEE